MKKQFMNIENRDVVELFDEFDVALCALYEKCASLSNNESIMIDLNKISNMTFDLKFEIIDAVKLS